MVEVKADANVDVKVITKEDVKITKGDYTLIFTDESGRIDQDIKNKLIDIYFKVYPVMAARFCPESPKEVFFKIISDPKAIAFCGGRRVVFSVDWFEKMPQDVDCATHELMHAVQRYPSYEYAWVVEGIADYARYKYGVENIGWSLPNYNPNQKYTDSYRVTGRFFAWLENHVCADIIDKMDAKLRVNEFSNATFEEITGKTVDELWAMYAENPEL